MSKGGHVQTLSGDTGNRLNSFDTASTGSRFEAGSFYFSAGRKFGAMDSRGEPLWRTKLPIADISGWAIRDGLTFVVGTAGDICLFSLPKAAVEDKK